MSVNGLKDKIEVALLNQYKAYCHDNPDQIEIIKRQPNIVMLDLRTLMNDLGLDKTSFTLNSNFIKELQNLELEGFINDHSVGSFGLSIDVHNEESGNLENRKIQVTDRFLKKL
ncbi:hypothetical protein ACRWQN_17460 [Shewanella sp. HL-SH8]|uniref:hypothetical protein n=1 Tax=Shewanella sp. HL-SH8 TaxID=3436242 RepID=UPI003EBB3920